MERIQYYPSVELKERMEVEAENRGVSLSQLSIDILTEYFGLAKEIKKPLPALLPQIMDEVAAFINKNDIGTEFDLLKASDTFKAIHMVAEGKPSANRASVGRSFAARVKMGVQPFNRVEPMYTDGGNLKKSANRAQMYKII